MNHDMTYAEAVDFLNGLINYEKTPSFTYGDAFKLDRVYDLMERLDYPERAWPAIHIAGTKGKGSVATFSDALLRAVGKRSGLYASPHLLSFRERVRVDGRLLDESTFAGIVSQLKPWIDQWQEKKGDDRLSFFDVLTAVGFKTFANENIDIGVIEVGMGGRLDATNVCQPAVCVITPIALEHTKFLGDTLAEIAREKGGIIKKGVSVIVGEQRPDAYGVIREICDKLDAPIIHVKPIPNVPIASPGEHQRWNFAAAVTAVRAAGVELDDETIHRVASETTIPGRLHEIAPDLFVDVAHTPESAAVLATEIERRYPDRDRTMVFACQGDKNLSELVLTLAPLANRVILPHMPGVRSMPPEEMIDEWRKHVGDVRVVDTTSEALSEARGSADLTIACGSFVLIGEVMEAVGYQPSEG
jgi:dihydrofolate synthase / folylpolyglutamate synthase